MLYLSKGGRITLIKSILSNMLTYFLSLFFPSLLALLTTLRSCSGIFFLGGFG
jgi:hypothetical protein